jgi:hypothetical protein
MNAKIGQVVNLYGAIKANERKREKLNQELNTYIIYLTEQEMAEYMKACDKIDRRHEEENIYKEGRTI